jgi:hypothetical protein
MVSRVFSFFLIILSFLAFSLFIYSNVNARELTPGQYDTVPQSTKDFFSSLKNAANEYCCSVADCEATDQWGIKDNHYRVYLSKWEKWVDVPSEKVIIDPEVLKKNPTGSAIVCYNKVTNTDIIYCFVPGAGT